MTASFVEYLLLFFEFDTRYGVWRGGVWRAGRPPSTVNTMFRVVQLCSTCYFHSGEFFVAPTGDNWFFFAKKEKERQKVIEHIVSDFDSLCSTGR